jgi:trk system potassium uptake protein TrkH
MSFSRYVQFARGETSALYRDSQIRAFLVVYLGFVLALLAVRALNADPIDETSVREVLFNLASVISTTGYASTDYSAWGPSAWTLIFCAMMICGCSGSTTGGPKVFRYQLLLGAISGEVRRLHSPNIVVTEHYQGQLVSSDVMDSVMAFFMMFFLTLGTGAVVLVLLGLDPVTAITGAATCLSNVGPGLGEIIGPAGNFASLDVPVKWVLSFLMLAGRLELLTVYVLVTAAFWRG